MILFCFGTRPEWIKIKPIVTKFNKEDYKILFTGQHTTLVNIDEDVAIDFDLSMDIKCNNRLDEIIANTLANFPEQEFDYVLVQGDTASAYSCALAAFNRRIKVIHLEAGLRSGKLEHPYPEEGYRQMISRIAAINLCPTDLSKANLDRESVLGENIVVGNTVLDNLVDIKGKSHYGNKVLITLHRNENDHINHIWFQQIEIIASKNKDLEFIFPMHPRPAVQKHRHIFKNVKVVDPMPHAEFLDLLAEARFIITDSGGLQEEGSYLGKKVIVCRETTERPEGILTGHIKLCLSPFYLYDLVMDVMGSYQIENDCPYGDGFSSNKIVDLLLK